MRMAEGCLERGAGSSGRINIDHDDRCSDDKHTVQGSIDTIMDTEEREN